MMKFRSMALAALAVTGTAVTAAPAEAQDTKALIETVGAMILADRLGIDPNMVLMAKMASGDSSVYDLAPMMALGAFGNSDMTSLMAMQSMGLGYGQMAPVIGVPQPTYVALQNTRSLDNNYVWADELGSRYSVGESKLQALNRAGYSWREIASALVESQQTGQPVEEALYENRLFGTNFEPGYYDPVYIPPRRSVRYVSWLPAPRTDWRWRAMTMNPQQVMWVNNGWRSVPVVTRWSPVRPVRQPLYVLESDGDLRLIRQPVFSSGPIRVAALSPRTVFGRRPAFVQPTSSRYAIREDWSTGRRAQRFAEPNYGQIRSAEVHRRNEIRKREHAEDVREMREERRLAQQRRFDDRRDVRVERKPAAPKREARVEKRRNSEGRAEKRQNAIKRSEARAEKRQDSKRRPEARAERRQNSVRQPAERKQRSSEKRFERREKRGNSGGQVRASTRVRANANLGQRAQRLSGKASGGVRTEQRRSGGGESGGGGKKGRG